MPNVSFTSGPVGGRASRSELVPCGLALPLGSLCFFCRRGEGAGRRVGGGARKGCVASSQEKEQRGASLARTEPSRPSRPGREADSPAGLRHLWCRAGPRWEGFAKDSLQGDLGWNPRVRSPEAMQYYGPS